MKTIYKFRLADHVTESMILVPKGALFLSVAVQFNEAVAYFECDDKEDRKEEVKIYACTTGGIHPGSLFQFIGTVMLSDGKYVLHYLNQSTKL